MKYLPVPDESKRHVKYETTLVVGEEIIVCFKVGHYEYPGKEVQEAYSRISKAVKELQHDLHVIREFSGNLVLYSMVSKIVNPEITEAMRQEFRLAAEEMYPDWAPLSDWDSQMGGIAGFSVQMRNVA